MNLTERRRRDGTCTGCGGARDRGGKYLRCERCNRKGRLQVQRYNERYPDRNRIAAREYVQRIRAKILTHYGDECACCGETEPQFLTIDHIEGGGTRHLQKIGQAGPTFYRWIIKNNYPSSLQILCSNCNCAKGHYGICPHQVSRRRASFSLVAT